MIVSLPLDLSTLFLRSPSVKREEHTHEHQKLFTCCVRKEEEKRVGGEGSAEREGEIYWA